MGIGKSTPYEDRPKDIFYFVVRKNFEAVRAILKKYPPLANSIHQNNTLFYQPCRRGSKEMIKLLIQCGADVNNCNIIGYPPLYHAICFNQLEITKILCQNNAKFEGVKLKDGISFFDLAVLLDRYEIALYLYSIIQDKNLPSVEYYNSIAKTNTNYFRNRNYAVFLESVKQGKSLKQLRQCQTKPKLSDLSQDEDQCCYCCFPPIINVKDAKKENNNFENNPQTDRKSLSKN